MSTTPTITIQIKTQTNHNALKDALMLLHVMGVRTDIQGKVGFQSLTRCSTINSERCKNLNISDKNLISEGNIVGKARNITLKP